MSNRKEELLAMLKSTLALSRNSLKNPIQEQIGGRNSNDNTSERKKTPVSSVASNADEEDEFLYGKSEAFVDNKYQAQRYRDKVETSFDYNHGGATKQRSIYSNESDDKHEFVVDSLQRQVTSKYDPYEDGDKKFYNSQFKNTRKIDQEPQTYEYTQSLFSSKIHETSRNQLEESDKPIKKPETDPDESNKLLDTILKTISMDENLSKIIVEKMKKPIADSGKSSAETLPPKEEVQKTNPVVDKAKSEITEQPIQTIVNLSDRYVPMKPFEADTQEKPLQSIYKPNIDQRNAYKLNHNLVESNWNRKTEEFLKKLQSQNSTTLKDVSRSSKDRQDSFISSPERKKCSPSLRASQQDESRKQNSTEKNNNTTVSSNQNETNPQEIVETINAVEAELEKLEQRRQFLLSKPPNPESEHILMINFKTQQDMKTQLALLKETFAQLENQKLKNVELASSNIPSKINNANAPSQISPLNKRKLSEDKRRSRSRSRSRGYKRSRTRSRSRSRSSGRYGKKKRYYDSKNSYHKSSHDSRYRRSDRSRSRSRSRRREESKNSNESRMKDLGETKSAITPNEAKEQSGNPDKEKPATENVLSVATNVPTKQQEDSKNPSLSNLKSTSEASLQKDMLEKMKFGIEFAIALFMEANRFFDGGNLWCPHCDKVFDSFCQFCTHLHAEEHLDKSGDGALNKLPILPRDQPAGPQSAPARGEEFIKPVQAFTCSLCKEFFEDNSKVKVHFTSSAHNKKFKEFLVKNNSYEIPYLAKRMNALFKKECASNPSTIKMADPSLDIFEDKQPSNSNSSEAKSKPVGAKKLPIENISITLTRKVGNNNDSILPEMKRIQVKPVPPPLSQQQMSKPKDVEQQKPMLLQPFKLNNVPRKNFPFKRS